MNFIEQAELAQTLLKAHLYEEALPLYRELYQYMTRDILDQALRLRLLIEIPGEAYMDLYVGESKRLSAYKVGISRDAVARAQEIRNVNARNRNGGDYELIRFVRGPVLSVRDAERRLKREYHSALVMGTEWVSFDAEDFVDAVWIEQDRLIEDWDRQMHQHDALATLQRSLMPLVMLSGAHAPAHLVELRVMSSFFAKWDEVYGYVQSRREGEP